jgi:DNA-binding transcriptional LysR family regulator
MDTFQNMRVFMRIVEAGSFTAAARHLQLSIARTSRALSDLERRLRTRLLDRTTRRLELTESGQCYLRRCEQILASVDEAEAEACNARARPSGKLRVHAMTSIGVHYVVPIIHQYQQCYPEVTIDLTLAQGIPDLRDDRYDVSIVLGNQLPESGLASQRLGRVFGVACASPAYLAGHGIPEAPPELANHICLHMTTLDWSRDQWSFDGPRGVETIVLPPASLQLNDAGAMATAVREGMGIAILPAYTMANWLKSGDIIRVMPDHTSRPINVYALYPSRRHPDAKTRTWSDFLRDHSPGMVTSDQAALSQLTTV